MENCYANFKTFSRTQDFVRTLWEAIYIKSPYFPTELTPVSNRKSQENKEKIQVGKNKENLQFLGVSTVSKTNFNIWQVSPIWAGRQRNITHAYCNKGIHFLADVIFKDWLVLVTADLVNNNIKKLVVAQYSPNSRSKPWHCVLV